MKRTGLAGLLLLVLAVPVARADVTVRAEGATATVLKATAVPRTGPDVVRQGKSCPGDSAAGAIQRATGGDWEGTYYDGLGFTVDRIFTEALPFSTGKYWGFDHNNVGSQVGICGYPLADGDEILFYAACATSDATDCSNGRPLGLTAPAKVTTGVPFTVTVRQFDDLQDPAVASPAAGASVGGATTAADGTAQLTLSTPGTVTLTATKGDQVRDEATVTVADPPAPGASPTPAPAATAVPAVVPDTRPPYSSIRGIAEQQVFRRAAPRTLRATVDESISAVTLGLTRKHAGRCTAFDNKRGAFVKVKCGRHPRFAVGSDAQVSFLLPKRLGPGRYVFDVVSTDAAGNEESLARGRNRVVFFVR